MILRLALPLLTTIIIELGVLLFLGERRRKVLWGSVVINVLTNVPLNLYAVNVSDEWPTVVVGETLVVLIESLCYWWLIRRWGQAFAYSLLCNAISFLTGELFILIYYYFYFYT